MSTSPKSENETEKPAKCTRGVKCILIHILVTVILLMILLIIYVVHILVVQHRGLEAFRISRRNLDQKDTPPLDVSGFSLVGAVYINSSPARVICSSVLLRPQWSLAPAHCVTIRSDPEHSKLLPKWKIRYKDVKYQETDIKKGLVHSFFNKDDFDNNIGLFQHLDQIELPQFKFSNKVVSDILAAMDRDMEIFGWRKVDETHHNKARVLNSEKCSEFVTPIVDVQRKAEVCLVQYVDDAETEDDVHGAAVILDSEIVGFFSWGDRSGQVPQVALVIAPYKSWIENMIELEI